MGVRCRAISPVSTGLFTVQLNEPAPPYDPFMITSPHTLTRSSLLLAALVLTSLTACRSTCPQPDSEPPGRAIPSSNYNFAETRQGHQTNLLISEPSPQSWTEHAPPKGVSLVHYTSEGRKLSAWLAMPSPLDRPPEQREKPVPAVVYLHGGFAFGRSDFDEARPFLEAGYAVLVPWYRGENGHEGNFEFMYGELTDAAAAVTWLANRDDIDAERVFSFGHSIGANLSAMLSLLPDAPVRLTGGAGGLYHPDSFYGWQDIAPFDVSNPLERELRIFAPHIDDMAHPHIAYIGTSDGLVTYARTAERLDAPLQVHLLKGDHFTTLEPAVALFLEEIRKVE